jgi:hypothetical protein
VKAWLYGDRILMTWETKEREKRTEQLMQAATSQYSKDPDEEDTPEEQTKNGI